MNIPNFTPEPDRSYHFIFPDFGKGSHYTRIYDHMVSNGNYMVPRECTGYDCDNCRSHHDQIMELNLKFHEIQREYVSMGFDEAQSILRNLRSELTVTERRERYSVLAYSVSEDKLYLIRMSEKTFNEKFYPALIGDIRGNSQWAELTFDYRGVSVPEAVRNLKITSTNYKYRVMDKNYQEHILHQCEMTEAI